MKVYDDYVRWMYRHSRPHWWAKAQNRGSAFVFGLGVWPSRVAALDVRGRSTGRRITLPVVLGELDGDEYLVSMLGERANWVRNVRVADGRAVLRRGRGEVVRLVEVPVAERPPLIRRYLQLAPGARPHIAVDRRAPVEAFNQVATDIPVFRITRDTSG